jgi:hypothetical protein
MEQIIGSFLTIGTEQVLYSVHLTCNTLFLMEILKTNISFFEVMLAFLTQLGELLRVLLLSPFPLVQLSPLPCVNKYTAWTN